MIGVAWTRLYEVHSDLIGLGYTGVQLFETTLTRNYGTPMLQNLGEDFAYASALLIKPRQLPILECIPYMNK
jgi:hypothetical protein